MNLFTIITINYNNVEGLRRTIESVVNQTSKDYEYIVIDGGSTDGSVEVIKEYASQIDYWVSEPDKGIYNAMNKGIYFAKGKYCNFMNSGDMFYDNKVIERVNTFAMTEDVVCGNIVYPGQGVWKNPDNITMARFYKHAIYHQACFIKTRLLKEHPYDENMKVAADWKWFIDMLIFRNATYAHIPVTISEYEGGGISETGTEIGKIEREQTLNMFLPSRVREDYDDYLYGKTPYRLLFTTAEIIPPIHKILYRINVLILKTLNLKLHSQWIKDLPWKE